MENRKIKNYFSGKPEYVQNQLKEDITILDYHKRNEKMRGFDEVYYFL